MRVLVADDDPALRRLLVACLRNAGLDPICASDGHEAWALFEESNAPRLAILDWSMPGLDGIELCRRLHARKSEQFTYAILLTAHSSPDELACGLEAGAHDFIAKPFRRTELAARVGAGARAVRREASLKARLDELGGALSQARALEGLLPICMHCKKIRDEDQAWQKLEAFIEQRSQAMFTHSVCGSCLDRHYPEDLPS